MRKRNREGGWESLGDRVTEWQSDREYKLATRRHRQLDCKHPQRETTNTHRVYHSGRRMLPSLYCGIQSLETTIRDLATSSWLVFHKTDPHSIPTVMKYIDGHSIHVFNKCSSKERICYEVWCLSDTVSYVHDWLYGMTWDELSAEYVTEHLVTIALWPCWNKPEPTTADLTSDRSYVCIYTTVHMYACIKKWHTHTHTHTTSVSLLSTRDVTTSTSVWVNTQSLGICVTGYHTPLTHSQ
jgi:hypothetical protein